MNPNLQDKIKERIHAAYAKMENVGEFPEWCAENIMLDGKLFSFSGHEYLREIYTNHHPYEVFLKAAQTGISTRVLLKTFWAGSKYPLRGLYYFPSDPDVEDFSNDRARRIIEESPFLSKQVKGINNVGLKQIGMSSLYFRGLWTKRKVKSVPADIIVLDELVEANLENVEFAKDRLMHSSLGWVMELSQPGLPGFGIDESFQRSDQRYWLLKCGHCGQWTNPVDTFPECLAVVGKPRNLRYFLACSKCGKDLDTQAGEWVPKYPDREDIRGYQVSALYSTVCPEGYQNFQEYAYKAWKYATSLRKKKRIIISIVGRPFADDTLPLNEQNLKPALGQHKMKSRHDWSFMGVDVGDELHVVIGSISGEFKLVLHWLEVTEDWNRLDQLMIAHQCMVCVIDAMPYKNSAKNFARRFPDNVWIQYFKGDDIKTGFEGEGISAVPKVTEDRTEGLDQTIADLKDGKIVLPDRSENDTVEICISHLLKLRKEREVSKRDGSLVLVYKKGGETHFGFALNNCRIATGVMEEQYGLGLIPSGGSFHDH